jgi:predicted nucleic acid-binding protein
VVIDASVAALAVRPDAWSILAERAWEAWRLAGTEIYAPQLWRYEVTSFIRKTLARGELEVDEAQAGLAAALALEVTLVPADDELCRSALHWAERINQTAAYDSFYLALASRLQADFWSADRRLINSARQTGVRWAHWVGELGEQPA